MPVVDPKTKKTCSITIRTMSIASAWIVGPILLGLVIGKRLDWKYLSDPWLITILLSFFFLVSIFVIVRNALREYKKIEEEEVKK